MDESPRSLVERAARGDRKAFADLIRIHERTALSIAYSVVGNATHAGDVTQEAFLRVWQKIADLDDIDRFPSWLATIVRNLAMDHLRRRPREKSRDGDEPGLEPASTTSPADELEQHDRRRQINRALEGLDELTRSAVVLKYYEGMSSKQIAELLELSPGAVDMRLSRGRELLREKLASIAKA